MIFNFKKSALILLLHSLIFPITVAIAANAEGGLDIQADSGDTNLQTSVSRLQGNVILTHGSLTVTGENAEIQAANENKPQIYVITGKPAKFIQRTDTSKINASSFQLVYTPAQELMEFQGKVMFSQTDKENQFKLTASKLDIFYKKGSPQQISATGSPVVFMHNLQNKAVEINAEDIIWDTQNRLAVLHNATVKEALTTFSAEKITYNAQTGEISASGDGNTRPSYQYTPNKTEEKNNKNDS